MFKTPAEQISQIKKWNKQYKWGFTKYDFHRVETESAISARGAYGLITPVLVPYLKDVKTTFNALSTIIKANYKPLYFSDYLTNPRLAEGITYSPGLRWEVLDFRVNVGKSATDLRDENLKSCAHLGVFAAACLFPKWWEAMDGGNVPYAIAPGLVVGSEDVPNFDRDERKFFVRAFRAGLRLHGTAMVALRESELGNSELRSLLDLELRVEKLEHQMQKLREALDE